MNVRSDLDSTIHKPTFEDARVALCGRRIVDLETWWAEDAELTCPDCAAKAEEER